MYCLGTVSNRLLVGEGGKREGGRGEGSGYGEVWAW